MKYIVNEEGKKVGVILSIEEYEELLEDLHDLAVVAERRDEETISFEELVEKLRKNGTL